MQREVIKPQPDIPVTVRLDKGPEGQEREGRYGVDYQYTVNQDRGVMWLPREARDQLVRCGAQAGDEVQIVKSLRGRQALWSVQVVPDSQYPPASNRPVPASAVSNGNRHYAGQAQPPQPQANMSPLAQQIAGCLRAAIDGFREAQAYACAQGSDLKFTETNITSMAASIYINARKENR